MDCLDCSKYLECKDVKKSKNYKCRRFVARGHRDLGTILDISYRDELDPDEVGAKDSTEIDLSDVQGEDVFKKDNIIYQQGKVNIAEMIDAVINSDLLTPLDTKIDDSSVPQAKNFFEFSTGQNFLNIKPYALQMLYTTQLFSEWCPRCSDSKWMRTGIKVDDSLALFFSKVKLLDYGICSSCGATRSELIQNGELNQYQEMAGLAGQRCIVGDSVVYTENGMVHADELDSDLLEGYNDTNTSLLNRDFNLATCSAIYKCSPEETVIVELSNGMWIEGTKEHPILTEHGYIPLSLSLGETVKVTFGSRFNGFGTSEIDAHLATFLGFWLACGSSSRLDTDNSSAFLAAREIFRNSIFKTDYCIIFDATKQNSVDLSFLSDKHKTIPKIIRHSSRLNVKLFLSAFFQEQCEVNQDIISIPLVGNRLLLEIASYLQMFGIKFIISENFIEIDKSCNVKFTSTFLMAFVPNGEGSICYVNSQDDCYLLKVTNVRAGSVKVTYDYVVPKTHSFIANGMFNHNSGKSALVAMGCAYLVHRLLKLQKPNEVYGLLSSNVLHGTFVALTYKQASETLWEPFLAYIATSPWFCIAEGTKISMESGSKNIEDIKISDKVKTFEGVNVVTNIFDNGYQECKKVSLENGSYLEATGKHKIRCLSTDKQSVIWKTVDELTTEDYLVIE